MALHLSDITMFPFKLRRPRVFDLYESMKDVHHITSTFPLLRLLDEKTAKAKNGSIVRCYALNGQDYTGMSEDSLAHLSRIRSRLFEMNTMRVSVTIHSSKKHSKHEALKVGSNELFDRVFECWESGFTDAYRTTHHVVVTVSPLTKAQKAAAKIESSLNKTSVEVMNEFESSLLSKLKEFSPYRLEREPLTSYFATLLSGRLTYCNATNWDDSLLSHHLHFDPKKNYCIYGKDDSAIYGSYLTVNAYPDQLTESVLRKVYAIDLDITITQSFTPISESEANNIIELQERIADNNRSSIVAEEAMLLKEELEAENLTLLEHTFSIEVLSSSVEELNERTQRVIKLIENQGISIVRESIGIEPAFWARFPTLTFLNRRTRKITNHNASDLMTFEKVGEGFDSNGFGDRPITHFLTSTNSLYSFNLHKSPKRARDILGHTVIYGGTGTGKSTLISFIVSMCMSYPKFKALLFDKEFGLESFTHCFGGDYLDFGKHVDLNPLQMKDTESNRAFLSRFIRQLAGVTEANDRELSAQIERGVERVFKTAEPEMTLREALEQTGFGKVGGELYNRLKPWTTNTLKGNLFNAKRDVFNFESDLVTFDATYLLSDSDNLGAVTTYIFQKYFDYISKNDTSSLVFFDESQKYLKNAHFRDQMKVMLDEVRKKGGVVVLAAQSPEHHMKAPDGAGNTIKTNIANIICYPDPNASREHYVDYLGFTESEFIWVKETSPDSRQVIFKRTSTGESVILNVDLNALNSGEHNYLNAFNSGNTPRLYLEQLMKSNPKDWLDRYLATDLDTLAKSED